MVEEDEGFLCGRRCWKCHGSIVELLDTQEKERIATYKMRPPIATTAKGDLSLGEEHQKTLKKSYGLGVT
jgi:hypothetical protein